MLSIILIALEVIIPSAIVAPLLPVDQSLAFLISIFLDYLHHGVDKNSNAHHREEE
jgi:hypothetical protein